MKILNLTEANGIYTSNVYLVLGSHNTLDDVNTLVDVGRDPSVLERIESISTGIGKRRIEQVILTHCHYDHASLLPVLCERYRPQVYTFSDSPISCNEYKTPTTCPMHKMLVDQQVLRLGDADFEVIHMPGHSNDSICHYSQSGGVLFEGDSNVIVRNAGGTYEDGFVNALGRVARRDVKVIYPGHGDPLVHNCNAQIRSSLRMVKRPNVNAGMVG